MILSIKLGTYWTVVMQKMASVPVPVPDFKISITGRVSQVALTGKICLTVTAYGTVPFLSVSQVAVTEKLV